MKQVIERIFKNKKQGFQLLLNVVDSKIDWSQLVKYKHNSE